MRLFLLSFLCSLTIQLTAQDKLPAVLVKTPAGKEINTQALLNDNAPLVISFWATWCKPCLQELDAFNDLTETWKKETNANIIAISIDDSRTASGIKKTIGLHDWSFSVFWDENQELKRALNISLIPIRSL